MTAHDNIIPHSLTREQVRSIDREAIEEYDMSGLVLMENAGRGAAECIHEVFPEGSVGILCGKGNNAGDGYVIARHLQLLGREVHILQCFAPEELAGDALSNWKIAQHAQIHTTCIDDPAQLPSGESFCVLVDCLLGTGATGNPRSPLKEAVQWANQQPAKRVAIDIPTGLDCESGEPGAPCFQADLTCTFVASKTGFATAAANEVLGRVEVIAIGVPARLLKKFQEV